MPSELLKFRCYQCNQLLASSPAKSGSTVSCPRCKAELVVPAPDASAILDPKSGSGIRAPRTSTTATVTTAKPQLPSSLDEAAATIPADLADLRPEDLRVEAEFVRGPARPPEREASPEPVRPVSQESVSPLISNDFTAAHDFTAAPPEPAPAPVPNLERPSTRPTESRRLEAPAPPTPWLTQEPVTAPANTGGLDVPPIKIDPISILPSRNELPPIREVVLPAQVVLAWSLFGLIGIAVSFVAGLMVGHFVWRV